MLPTAQTYDDLIQRFSWNIPAFYNLGVDVSDRLAEVNPSALALIDLGQDGQERHYTFSQIAALSNQLANVLQAHGLQRGDRVGVLLPQALETALSHVAVTKLGAI
ncbi:MAG: AMP-binding protein, partial [Pseudomonadota bacterium]